MPVEWHVQNTKAFSAGEKAFVQQIGGPVSEVQIELHRDLTAISSLPLLFQGVGEEETDPVTLALNLTADHQQFQ